jgi:hypothetical protein
VLDMRRCRSTNRREVYPTWKGRPVGRPFPHSAVICCWDGHVFALCPSSPHFEQRTVFLALTVIPNKLASSVAITSRFWMRSFTRAILSSISIVATPSSDEGETDTAREMGVNGRHVRECEELPCSDSLRGQITFCKLSGVKVRSACDDPASRSTARRRQWR